MNSDGYVLAVKKIGTQNKYSIQKIVDGSYEHIFGYRRKTLSLSGVKKFIKKHGQSSNIKGVKPINFDYESSKDVNKIEQLELTLTEAKRGKQKSDVFYTRTTDIDPSVTQDMIKVSKKKFK